MSCKIQEASPKNMGLHSENDIQRTHSNAQASIHLVILLEKGVRSEEKRKQIAAYQKFRQNAQRFYLFIFF
jgi:hypothetical protein